MDGPLIGITADATAERFSLARPLADLVVRAGGVPAVLPCLPDCIGAYLDRCDGFILSGGDDPDTRQWGIPLHPKAKPIDPDRQRFEWALLEALDARRGHPVLGVCLGMQMMAIHAGGTLDQHLPDGLATAADHWDRSRHPVSGALGDGIVHSHHRQAIVDPGSLRVAATAPDGVIEAVRREDDAFYLGVQWHPERTDDPRLGLAIAEALVTAAG
jgi:putative glutamine amidotransferase